MKKYVYSFNEGSKDMRSLLGGKGANLAEMTNIGLPVPFGFTVTTEACNKYYGDGQKISKEIEEEIFIKLAELEKATGKEFGGVSNPLLVSVRSGGVFSMPGMMDTVLNLGLNDETLKGLMALTGNERFALDSYRRFIQMFSDIVLEVPKAKFDAIFETKKIVEGCALDVDLSSGHLKAIIADYKTLVKNEIGKDFPQEPREQLMEAVKAVFRSWNNERAILYRQLNHIPSNLGTAVSVQSMVFGNMGDTSGTGVAFTRSPVNGEKKIFGEYLINAQGEDVVAGIRTPQPISQMEISFPEVYKEFIRIAGILENHYTDMQDLEFTIEREKLFMLQTRNGKRTAAAAIKIAVDMEKEGLIDKRTAVTRLDAAQVDQLLHPMFVDTELLKAKKLATGLPASPGAATGKIYFHAKDAIYAAGNGEKVILIRQETNPEDLAGMVVAQGILTARGGMTSHAAVVARGMGKCCVAGCSEIRVDETNRKMEVGGVVYKEGTFISLNGSDGTVYEGKIKTVIPELSGDFGVVMGWADEIRTLKVRANADNPKDATQAIGFGAEGIGLCRTEHMFFEEDRIPAIRKMILSDTEEERRAALATLMPYQKDDFKGIFEVMGDRPVTIRLLDPPLHEFLPQSDTEVKTLAEKIDVSVKKLTKKITELHEFNPMLGHRGCRLTITYPEIAEMQAEAIIMAAIELKKEKNLDVIPEIMIPLVGVDTELTFVKKTVLDTINRCFEREGIKVNYLIGTMIEVPRACLTSDEIAKDAEFFSFGTNDLTQMGFGFSRDDTGDIIKEYRDKDILEADPFQTIDTVGIGKLMKMSVELGKATRPDLKIGICGEHGGDPRSVEFCHNIGLDYVSCSPFRVPIARLAAAQAVVKAEESGFKDV